MRYWDEGVDGGYDVGVEGVPEVGTCGGEQIEGLRDDGRGG